MVYIARDSPDKETKITYDDSIKIYHIPRKLHLTYLFDFNYLKIIRMEKIRFFYFRNDSPYNFLTWVYSRLFSCVFVHANTSDWYTNPYRFTSHTWSLRSRNLFKTSLLLVEYFLMDFFLNFCIRHSDRTIVETDFQYESFSREFGIKPTIIRGSHPLPTGDDFVKSNPPEVLWVANAKPLKRPELFLHLATQMQGDRAQFVMVVGKTSPTYLTELRKKADLLDNLTLHEELPLDEVERLFERASVFVNTSEYESIPNTYIQAWLRRTPVVTLECDPDGIIEQNQLGFHSRTMENLLSQTRLLTENISLRTAIGNKARAYANENHSLHRSTLMLESIFHTISLMR